MADGLSLRDLLSHPASKATGLVALLGGILKLPLLAAIWAGLWGQLGTAFTVVSIFGFTVAPEVSFVPTQGAKVLALSLAALYGLKKLLDVVRGIRARVKEVQE